jgi:hypothetical protein
MAVMTPGMFLLLNAGCFVFILLFLLSFSLSKLVFFLALALMIIALYNVIRVCSTNQLNASSFLRSPDGLLAREGKAGLSEFERKVR